MEHNLLYGEVLHVHSSVYLWEIKILVELVLTTTTYIDLFASGLNVKVGLFVSWHPEPGCHSVDAFNLCWTPRQCCMSFFHFV